MSKKAIAVALIALINMGVFAMPTTTKADWSSLLGSFGIGGSSQNAYNNQNYYDYNSTSSYDSGDIKISKEVRAVGNSKYHDKITIRSGAAVEVWIEVKNTSSKYNADTIVRDEIGGSSVYVKNSLRVNGQSAQPGLTSTGLRVNIPKNGKVTITYQMNVCNSTNYPMRAYASAPSVGAATDAIIIYTETFNVGGYDNTYSCISQFQTNTGTNGATTVATPAGNPFGDWTGVNNATTTNTSTTSTTAAAANNPFAGWTGVDNSNATNVSNPFGDWTGVQNDPAGNPFGDWTGVQSSTSAQTDPFGNWYGVNSSTSSNPFGDWTGTQSADAQYDMGGYSTGGRVAYQSTSPTVAQSASQPATYFVAPTTGVSKTAPFVFAGLLTAGFIAFRKRQLLFN